MCGIAGFLTDRGIPDARGTLHRITRSLRHRGPDDEGAYLDDFSALGVCRLSIADFETGDQPIANEDGTIWVVHNGEIYNLQPLRDQLERRGHRFRTQSDTEVIVHAYEEYGEDCASALDRSEEHTSELQSHLNLVCRLLLEKKTAHVCTPVTRA